MAKQEEIEQFWRTTAGARLFNVIGDMELVSKKDAARPLFSERKTIALTLINELLDAGWIPADPTQRIKP